MAMMRLYKLIGNDLNYWETNDKGKRTAVIHWGIIGQPGQNKEIKSGIFSSLKKMVQKEIDAKLKEGYTEFEDDDYAFLEIEYMIDGFGIEKDIDKRHRLEDKIAEVLALTGLGYTNGGSFGRGTMDAGCIVVDFNIAKKVIEEALVNTEFADYLRIFRMDINETTDLPPQAIR